MEATKGLKEAIKGAKEVTKGVMEATKGLKEVIKGFKEVTKGVKESIKGAKEENITRGTGDTSKEVEDTREVVAVAGSRELAGEQEAEAGAPAGGEEEGNIDLLCLLLDCFQEIYTLL